MCGGESCFSSGFLLNLLISAPSMVLRPCVWGRPIFAFPSIWAWGKKVQSDDEPKAVYLCTWVPKPLLMTRLVIHWAALFFFPGVPPFHSAIATKGKGWVVVRMWVISQIHWSPHDIWKTPQSIKLIIITRLLIHIR